MKANGNHVKRLLSVLLCCVLLLLPLGMTVGAAHEEGPEYQEDLHRSSYISDVKYGFKRADTGNNVNFYFNCAGESGVTNIKVWVEVQSAQGGQWGFYMDENNDSGLMGSGCPLKYNYTRSLPDGQYHAIYTVRAYKLLIYQTFTYTSAEIFLY